MASTARTVRASLTRRLSLTIFLAVLASLVVFAVAVSIAWRWNFDARDEAFARRLATELAAEVLPAADAGPEALQRGLMRWHRRTRADMTVIDQRGEVIASVGRRLPHEGPRGPGRGLRDFGPRQGQPGVIDIELEGGRTLLIRPDPARPGPTRPLVSLPLALALLLAAVAVVAWPVSRRITRRLENLQRGVEQQGAGDLAARVAVQGRDEVAALAESFNRSASRIEDLVRRQDALLASQKRLLANASHELRSPLARIRMAIELVGEHSGDPAALLAEARRNIGELDALVEEILLASRLETAAPLRAEVDLVGLAAEEASRVGAEIEIEGEAPPPVQGDVRLLRRMLRNLLENAARYHPRAGAGETGVAATGDSAAASATDASAPRAAQVDAVGEPIRVVLGRTGGRTRIAVLDRGRGVPEAARERIFEAFFRVEGHSEQAGGVGLGLALVRQIAEMHGGSVRCDAREGGGSRFEVELP